VVTVGTTVLAFALALYLQAGDLAPRFTSVMLLASYWVAPFVGIIAVFWWQRPAVETFVAAACTPVRRLPWRPSALAALLVGFLGCLPFSNTTLGGELAERGPVYAALFGSVSRSVLHGADLAYPVGIVLGAGTYVLLEGVRALHAERDARIPQRAQLQTG
jgi:purine-cytosine permease-like protein